MLTDNKKREVTDVQLMSATRHSNIQAATQFFIGGIVFNNAGLAEKTDGGGPNPVLGIAANEFDNSGGAATTEGELFIETGQIEYMTLTGVTLANVGAAVYAEGTDDETITLTATANSRLGYIHEVVDVAAEIVAVKIDPNS